MVCLHCAMRNASLCLPLCLSYGLQRNEVEEIHFINELYNFCIYLNFINAFAENMLIFIDCLTDKTLVIADCMPSGAYTKCSRQQQQQQKNLTCTLRDITRRHPGQTASAALYVYQGEKCYVFETHKYENVFCALDSRAHHMCNLISYISFTFQ